MRPSPRLLASADLVWTRIDPGDQEFDIPADTVTALHLGGEFAIPRTFGQLFIRAGAFVGHESADFEGSGAKNSGATFGAGIAAGQHFQMDFAYVTAYSRIVLSSGFRF